MTNAVVMILLLIGIGLVVAATRLRKRKVLAAWLSGIGTLLILGVAAVVSGLFR